MRPAGRGALDSLYFRYPLFAFRRPPELQGQHALHSVVIAGAGPVGMVAAIELARRGIPSVVVDDKNTLNDGSRAICVSRSSLETLQQLGLSEPFERKALGWTHGRCYYRGELIYRLEMSHSGQERFLPMYNLQQQYIEQFLVDRIAEFPGLIDLRWQSEVVALTQDADQVELTISTPEGRYTLRSRYVLAADGARSPIRTLCGLKLNGENLPGRYVIADVQMKDDFPVERRSFFEPVVDPESTILIHRQPDDVWRIDWQLTPGQDPDDAIEEGNIRQRLESILRMIGHRGAWQLEWWSIYTANTLCLDDYRHRRVLFIGDSAHIVPIFGVRGLNNGIADASNAAWKLAFVLGGTAGEGLLDSYTPERRGATLDVFRNAGKSSRFMTPPSRGYALLRKAALQLSLRQEFTRRFADPRQVQPYTYADSPLTSCPADDGSFGGGVRPGEIALNRRIADDDFLLDHLGLGFTAMYFLEQGALPDEVCALPARLQAIDPDFKLLVVARTPQPVNDMEWIIDTSGSVFTGYAARDGCLYLIRPDRYVAARWTSTRTGDVERALCIALARIGS